MRSPGAYKRFYSLFSAIFIVHCLTSQYLNRYFAAVKNVARAKAIIEKVK